MEAARWYGVRTIYEHEDLSRGRERVYEERIVLFQVSSQDEAIAEAETEARSYAESQSGTHFLGYSMSYGPFDTLEDKAEIFSLMRDSRLEPERYLDRFFDTGRERSR